MLKIQKIARELQHLEVELTQKLWAHYTTGLDFGVDAARDKIRKFYSDKESYRAICESLDDQKDCLSARCLQILYREFHPYHLSDEAFHLKGKIETLVTKLGDLLNRHRTIFEGREVSSIEIGRILSDSGDRQLRQKAYFSRTQINRVLVKEGFLELLNLRKEYAAACGAQDFVAFRLEQDDLPKNMFDGWREQCLQHKQDYQKVLNKLAQKFLGVDKYRPWDRTFLINQISPKNRHVVNLSEFQSVLERVFNEFGFEMEGLNITYDIFPRKNKSEWGYNFPIEIGKDCRVLANVDNRLSSYWVLLHEAAHAVHFLSLDPEEIILNRGVSNIVAEGFANFFGDLLYSRRFLSQFFTADLEEASREFATLKAFSSLGNVASLGEVFFDQELYQRELKNLEDVSELKWSTERDLLDEDPFGDEPVWGDVIHHTTHPIYLHNYFLGDVMCEGVKTSFYNRTGALWSENPVQFGAMWKEEVLKPSGRHPFAELFERVTGQDPNVSGYIQSVLSDAESCL